AGAAAARSTALRLVIALGGGADGVVVSLSSCPGKICDFQPSPLAASTDAVAMPYRAAIDATVSPGATVCTAGIGVAAAVVAGDGAGALRVPEPKFAFGLDGFLGVAPAGCTGPVKLRLTVIALATTNGNDLRMPRPSRATPVRAGTGSATWRPPPRDR